MDVFVAKLSIMLTINKKVVVATSISILFSTKLTACSWQKCKPYGTMLFTATKLLRKIRVSIVKALQLNQPRKKMQKSIVIGLRKFDHVLNTKILPQHIL